jgi:hypothetical protein
MTVAELMKVLEGIASGLSTVADKPAKELMSFLTGMKLFADQTVPNFVAFLAKCEEFERTGAVTTGKRAPSPRQPKAGLSVAEAIAAVRGILGQINQGVVTGQLIDETVARFMKLKVAELAEILKGLDIQGKPKNKQDAVGKIKQVLDTQFEMYLRTHPGNVDN